MDPINILVAINLFASITANYSGAKKGIKSKLSNTIIKPKTYLQKVPPNIAALVFLLTILAIFNIGTFSEEIKKNYYSYRIIGLIFFVIFSWIQVYSYKYLGENYSQEILIFKNHNLINKGFYRFIRHPQYVSQILSDLGVGVALMGYLVIPIVLILEIPLFILRAKKEEEIFEKHFRSEFTSYKEKTGFFFPFIG